jgi:hypothetical protein
VIFLDGSALAIKSSLAKSVNDLTNLTSSKVFGILIFGVALTAGVAGVAGAAGVAVVVVGAAVVVVAVVPGAPVVVYEALFSNYS